MNSSDIYIYVPNSGFVMDFDLSGPELKFVQHLKDAQAFDTITQAKHVIRHNQLVDHILINEVVA